jgi:hypothetical protein
MTLALQTPAAPRALGRVVNAEMAAAPYQVHAVSADQVERAQIENAAAVIGESQVWDLSVSKTGPRIPCKVIQLPHVAHAMLVSSMPPAKAGMVYRVWLVRKGKVHMGAVVAAGPKNMTIIPMRVQSGDVIAFSEEPKGGSALPTGPFVMEQTL